MPNPNQQNGGGPGQAGQQQPMNPEAGSQPQAAGNSGNPGQNTQATGTPAANQAERDAAGQEQQGQGPRDNGQKGKTTDRLPDEQQGASKSNSRAMPARRAQVRHRPSSSRNQKPASPSSAAGGPESDEGAGDSSKTRPQRDWARG
jgi:hypothetical protein